ncbi:amidohydrolase [Thermoplasmatales archaeon AK]|nr:amidohydrolase [Thermoplasmatales archaeon AK]
MLNKPEELQDVTVVDCDSHILELPEDIKGNMDKGKDTIMVLQDVSAGTRYWSVDGKLYTRPYGFAGGQIRGLIDHMVHPKWGTLNPKVKAKDFSMNDLNGRLTDLDEMGVDLEVINPSAGLMAYNMKDRIFADSFCRAYNNYVAKKIKENGTKRLYATGIVPLQDPDLAVKELERISSMGVFKGLAIPAFISSGNFHADKPIYHEDYFRFLKRAADLKMPIAIHVIPAVTDMPFQFLFYNWMYVRTFGFAFAAMISITGLITEGIFERIPNLRVILTEAGSGWLPYWNWWLDENFEKMDAVKKSYLTSLGIDPYPHVKKLASEYLSGGNVYCTLEGDEDPDLVRVVIEKMKLEDNLLFATDYPHIADIQYYPDNLNMFLENIVNPAGLTRKQTSKILGENAKELFHIS